MTSLPLEQITLPVVITNPEGEVLGANSRYKQLLPEWETPITEIFSLPPQAMQLDEFSARMKAEEKREVFHFMKQQFTNENQSTYWWILIDLTDRNNTYRHINHSVRNSENVLNGMLFLLRRKLKNNSEHEVILNHMQDALTNLSQLMNEVTKKVVDLYDEEISPPPTPSSKL